MELMLVIHSQIQISVKLLAPLLIIILVCYTISLAVCNWEGCIYYKNIFVLASLESLWSLAQMRKTVKLWQLLEIIAPCSLYRISVLQPWYTSLLTGCAGAEPHNSVKPAQSEKICKISHYTEMFTWNVNENRYFYWVSRFLEYF